MASVGFMASEVARLVCGYLHSKDCTNTKASFIEECPPELKIREFASLVDQGILRTFDVNGLTLDDILEEYAQMKASLDNLLTSAFRPDELVMYKSDGPLRKLKILSEHWVSKAQERDKPQLHLGRGRIPSSSDSSPDLPPVCSRLSTLNRRSRPYPQLQNEKKAERPKSVKESLKLHHSYTDLAPSTQPASKKPALLPVKRSGKRPTYTQGVAISSIARSSYLKKNKVASTAAESSEMVSEIKRMLKKPNEVNLEDKIISQIIPTPSPSTPRKSSGGSDVDNNLVFKTPSPAKALPSSPVKALPQISTASPIKSRKNALKSKVPTRKSAGDLSMPILVGSQDEKIKKALAKNDDEVSKALGEPIANAINGVGNNSDKIVESFMANSELMENLLDLLDEVTASESGADTNQQGSKLLERDGCTNHLYDQPPPSNASSRLAIDDSSVHSAKNSPAHSISAFAVASPISSKAPEPMLNSDLSGQAIAQMVQAFNQNHEVEQRRRLSSALDSETEAVNTIDMDVDEDTHKTPQKPSEAPCSNQTIGEAPKVSEAPITSSIINEDPVKSPERAAVNSEEAVFSQHEQSPIVTPKNDKGSDDVIEVTDTEATEVSASDSKDGDNNFTNESPMLRRSTRQRKANTFYKDQEPSKKLQKKEGKELNICTRSRMLPTLQSLVTSDTRNLQLVTPIMNVDNESVANYLRLCCEASVVTSSNIDEAQDAGINLDEVSLANSDLLSNWLKSSNVSFAFDPAQESNNEQPRKSEVLRDHIIEDSIERAIMSASAKNPSKTPDKSSKKNDDLEQEVMKAAQASLLNTDSSSGFFKTPTKVKSRIEQDLELTNTSTSSMGALLFKTPVKKESPIRALEDHMSEDSIERALSAMMNSPTKGRILEEKAAQAAESLMKTPVQKLKKRSPMPSPFLLSPGTPSKDISVASISFNREMLTVTPSIAENSDASLSLEISPSDPRASLGTPSPQSAEECLVTPPGLSSHEAGAPNDKYSLNGSMGAPRTPRGIGKAVSDLVMSSPLRALSDAAKKLFASSEGPSKTFVFLSPSKRQPKRAALMSVDTRSPLRLSSSSWEAKHDVNNLDHYQLIVKETEPTPSASRKRRLSNNPGVKAKRAKTEASVTYDVNVELVPQLGNKTPSKANMKPLVEKASISESNTSLPDALGLVPTFMAKKTPEMPKTPKTPTTRSSERRSRMKKLESVQRNLLDDEGFLSPIKKASKAKTTPVITGTPLEPIIPTKGSKKTSTPLVLRSPKKTASKSPSTGKKLIKSSTASVAPTAAQQGPKSFVFKTPQKQPPKASQSPARAKPGKKAAASPAKVKSAFMSPSKSRPTIVPSSPAKSVARATALLSISQPFDFFEQIPFSEDL